MPRTHAEQRPVGSRTVRWSEQTFTRVHRAPIAAHAAMLAVAMLVLLPVVGWHGVLSTDEGAAIAQARSLSSNGSFGMSHPLLEADPSGAHFPFEKSAASDGGYAPLPKKPAYSLLLAAVDRAGGVPAMLLLSIGGTVAAATLTAMIARLMNAALAVPAFWLAGAASPLFIDGFLIIAHTITAACCAGALLMAARSVASPHGRPGSPAWHLGSSAILAILLGAAVLLRAEAALFGAALTIGALFIAAQQGVGRRSAGMVAAAAMLSTTVAFAVDRGLTARYFGAAPESAASVPADDRGFLLDQLRALVITTIRPGYGAVGTAGLLLVLVAVVGLVAVREARSEASSQRTVRVLAAAVAVLVALRAAVPGEPPQLVPGLFVAAPLLLWGLAALDRRALRSGLAALLAITGIAFAGAVAATQYPVGGGFEWGGRYFALGLPCAVPLATAGLARVAQRVDVGTRRVCAIAALGSASVLCGIGLHAVHTNRDNWSGLTQSIMQAGRGADPGDGGRPVVVSTKPEPPRAAWDTHGDARWLLVADAEIPGMLDRLEGLGIRQLVLVTRGDSLLDEIDASGYEPTVRIGSITDGTWWTPILRLR